jgi:hypothetical protein
MNELLFPYPVRDRYQSGRGSTVGVPTFTSRSRASSLPPSLEQIGMQRHLFVGAIPAIAVPGPPKINELLTIPWQTFQKRDDFKGRRQSDARTSLDFSP